MTTYNGWPNKVTWQVSLYCTSLEDVQYAREWLEEIASELPLIAMDLLTSAIAQVEWEYLEQVFTPETTAADSDDSDDNAD